VFRDDVFEVVLTGEFEECLALTFEVIGI